MSTDFSGGMGTSVYGTGQGGAPIAPFGMSYNFDGSGNMLPSVPFVPSGGAGPDPARLMQQFAMSGQPGNASGWSPQAPQPGPNYLVQQAQYGGPFSPNTAQAASTPGFMPFGQGAGGQAAAPLGLNAFGQPFAYSANQQAPGSAYAPNPFGMPPTTGNPQGPMGGGLGQFLSMLFGGPQVGAAGTDNTPQPGGMMGGMGGGGGLGSILAMLLPGLLGSMSPGQPGASTGGGVMQGSAMPTMTGSPFGSLFGPTMTPSGGAAPSLPMGGDFGMGGLSAQRTAPGMRATGTPVI